jgi:transposase
MVALSLHAYCLGIRSSRRIERACQSDVAFRVMTASGAPDHTTIARFRNRHQEGLRTLFSASLRLCARAGMAEVGLVVLDGTKMEAAASMRAKRHRCADR